MIARGLDPAKGGAKGMQKGCKRGVCDALYLKI